MTMKDLITNMVTQETRCMQCNQNYQSYL